MATAVGLSAPETAASVRGGVMRFAESPLHDHQGLPFTLAEMPEDGLSKVEKPADMGLTTRATRILRIASLALGECLRPLREAGTRPGLILSLPDPVTPTALDGPAFLERLALRAGGSFDPARSDASLTGRAGGLAAVTHAVELIRGRHASILVAGGVDTYRDPLVLALLDRAGRVKSPVHLDGFIPGEGAGFLLLAEPSVAAGVGLTPLATVGAAAWGFESGHLGSATPYKGDGLAATFETLFGANGDAGQVDAVYASMNGEAYWAKEWGVAFLRHRRHFTSDPAMHHPADAFGDTGAASGPIMAGLAALGLRAGRHPDPTLVYASSDLGPRCAVLLHRA